MLDRLGHFASSHPWRYIAAWLGAVAILIAAVITVGPAFTSTITAPASESSAGLDILTAESPVPEETRERSCSRQTRA
jgi:hypothetical protein